MLARRQAVKLRHEKIMLGKSFYRWGADESRYRTYFCAILCELVYLIDMPSSPNSNSNSKIRLLR